MFQRGTLGRRCQHSASKAKSLSASILEAIGMRQPQTAPTEPQTLRATPLKPPLVAATTTDPASGIKVLDIMARDDILFDKLRVQFESKLQHKNKADTAWDDYSILLDSMLDKVSMSIVSHHFLFKSISTTTATEATDLSSKAMLLDKIVDRLGSSARMEEFIALAEVYERQKDLSKLRALVSRIKSMLLVPHIYVWNCLLRVTLAKKDYPAAVALFDMLRESSMVSSLSLPPGASDSSFQSPVTKSLSSAAPIAATYLPMLRYYLDTNQLETIDVLFNEMKDRHIRLSAAIYEIQMNAHLRRGGYRHVVDLFEELQSSFPISSLSSPPPQRLSACYLAVIFALEKLNQVDRIVVLYETDPRVSRLLAVDHDCVLRNRMLDAISRDARFIPQAFKIFNLEKELDNVATAGTYSSDLLNAHSYRIMIAMCCRFVDLQDPKLLDTALMFLERMKHEFQHKSNLSAYSAVVYTLAKQVTNGGSGSRNWMRVLEEKYSEMVAVFGVGPIQPMLHQNVITAFISNSNNSSKDNNSESLDSAYESLKVLLRSGHRNSLVYIPLVQQFISQVSSRHSENLRHLDQARTLLRSSSALVSKHSSETLTLDVTSMEAAIGTLISAYSNNSKMASKESILETCHKIFLDYKVLQTTAFSSSMPSSSKAVDAMVLAITTHSVKSRTFPELLSFLVSIQGIWRVSVHALMGAARVLWEAEANGEPLDALIRCLESEWSHRRVYLILKTLRDSLEGRAGAPAVAGVDAVEWSEAGLSREDVEDVHGFAIEAGRRCAL